MCMLRPTLLIGAVAASACAPPPEGPKDLTEAMRALWRSDLQTEDELLQLYLEATLEHLDPEALAEGPIRGTQLGMEPVDLEHIEFYDRQGKPTEAPPADRALPAYVLSRFSCSIEQILDIVTTDNQNALYGSARGDDGPYEAYSRTYHAPKKDFRSGKVPTLSWEGSLTTFVPIAGTYVYDFRTDARRFPVPGDLDLPEEEAVLTRTWLPYPAEWDGNSFFDQDYQLELFIPWGDGEVLHVYPVWRDWGTPLGDFSNGGVISITLDQMEKWDRNSETICEAAEG